MTRDGDIHDAARAPAGPGGDPGSAKGVATSADDPEGRRAKRTRRARRSVFRQTFGRRLLITFAGLLTLVTAFVFVVAGIVMHHTNYRVLERQVGKHLESLANMAARELDKPLFLEAARGRQDERTRRLARSKLSDLCRQLKERGGVSEVVVFVGDLDDPADLVVLGSSEGGEEVHESALARLLADNLAIERALVIGETSSSTLYSDKLPDDTWRSYKSAYAPILTAAGQALVADGKRPRGEVLALVGVELPADFTAIVDEVDRGFMFLGTGAGLTVLAAAVFLVRQRVHVPIFRLVRAMQHEGGPQRARVRFRDEIGVLTERYNEMVDRLLEANQELRELYAEARETATYLKGYSEHLVAGVLSGVVAVDPHGRVTVWNESARRILRRVGERGAEARAVLGQDHPLARALDAALAGSVTDQALVVLDPGDSEDDPSGQRLVELTCAPFLGEAGQLLGAVALANDRTELEHFRRVASRNERLAAIGNLGAGLAHEIKNPLGAISGFAELIERKQGQDAARLAKRLRNEVDELNRFLNEFLAFARENTIRREPVDLEAILRRSVELGLQGLSDEPAEAFEQGDAVQLTFPGGGVLEVRLSLADDLPRLALDATLLRSACANLVRNAAQAMPDGGRLEVRATRSGQQLLLRFRDQGPGIPLEDRERIFNPLFTTRAEGTGLGLAITHKTVMAHGGKLSVRDAPGGGAEFVIHLPLVAAAPELPPPGPGPATDEPPEISTAAPASPASAPASARG